MAEYRLAKLYERGEGVPRDMAAARSWTEKAAIGGNRLAMHDLAVFYAEGDAGPQSYAAAVEWFRAASDLGLVDSQYNLAVLYEQGLGLSRGQGRSRLLVRSCRSRRRPGRQPPRPRHPGRHAADPGRSDQAQGPRLQPETAGCPRQWRFRPPHVGHRHPGPDLRGPAPAPDASASPRERPTAR